MIKLKKIYLIAIINCQIIWQHNAINHAEEHAILRAKLTAIQGENQTEKFANGAGLQMYAYPQSTTSIRVSQKLINYLKQ